MWNPFSSSAPAYREVPNLFIPSTSQMAVVLWVMEGCPHCHEFMDGAWEQVTKTTVAQAMKGEAPPIQFFVIDASKPMGGIDADAGGIEGTPEVWSMVEGQKVASFSGNVPAKAFGDWLMGAAFAEPQ